MPGPIRAMLKKIRRSWLAATGQKHADGETAAPAVLHDPAARRPHDLDDPYFDPKVQRRFADVIANSMRNERPPHRFEDEPQAEKPRSTG